MKTILIVDDSEVIRFCLKDTLSLAGFNVIESVNGADALRVVEECDNTINVVITDLNMPVMDGVELIRNLRRTPNMRFVPILMLTTEQSSDKKEEGKRAGASGWLTKPFTPEQLIAVLKIVS